jgi:hypothetical protein
MGTEGALGRGRINMAISADGHAWFNHQDFQIDALRVMIEQFEQTAVKGMITLGASPALSMGDVSFSGLKSTQDTSVPAPWLLTKVTPQQLQLGTTALTIGAVWWVSRGAALLSTLLVTTPVWRQIDPLPVFSQTFNGHDDDDDEPQVAEQDPLDERAEGLFELQGNRSNEPQPIG